MDDALREFVRQRAAERCEYCLLPQSAARFFTFHVEHIRAKQHGGQAVILGVTALGRATVALLDMSEAERVEMREELLTNGEW